MTQVNLPHTPEVTTGARFWSFDYGKAGFLTNSTMERSESRDNNDNGLDDLLVKARSKAIIIRGYIPTQCGLNW
jgi:hypothetical protein